MGADPAGAFSEGVLKPRFVCARFLVEAAESVEFGSVERRQVDPRPLRVGRSRATWPALVPSDLRTRTRAMCGDGVARRRMLRGPIESSEDGNQCAILPKVMSNSNRTPRGQTTVTREITNRRQPHAERFHPLLPQMTVGTCPEREPTESIHQQARRRVPPAGTRSANPETLC